MGNFRRLFAEQIAARSGAGWWDAIVLTAGGARQAERYREEIDWRRRSGKLPDGVTYLVVPDPEGKRLGSGGATIHALGVLGARWKRQRVLMIHSGGDSRRLPQHSPNGKLFGAIPLKTPWGDTSTVFDEMMALSTVWLEKMPAGLLVSTGDVVLDIEGEDVDWSRPGATGLAIRQSAEMGSQHGVYVTNAQGRVYTYLQKPSAVELKAAGGLLEDGKVALDTGLLRFDAEMAERLAELAEFRTLPPVDLYEHITKALTGQWKPEAEGGVFWRQLAETFRGADFHCSVVEGGFTHVGTTRGFRSAAAGGVMDSVLAAGSELGGECVVLECDLAGRVRAGRGAILHGLHGFTGAVEVPENTVAHQIPVQTEDGRRGTVIRVYGVEDDPKVVAGEGPVTWFGRPVDEVFAELGIAAEDVWRGVTPGERGLWNAALFPVVGVEEAWQCARWMMGYAGEYGAGEWLGAERMSLADSAKWADGQALAEARGRRMQGSWQATAVALAKSGSDLRPMLVHSPGIGALAATGRELAVYAKEVGGGTPTEGASQCVQAARFLRQAGLEEEAARAEAEALRLVAEAVGRGVKAQEARGGVEWKRERVEVSAPPRIDLGGGWSDTPPFCQDWGGTVLNVALEMEGEYPIRTSVARLEERVLRCVSEETGEAVEYRTEEEAMEPARPGSSSTIPRLALQMTGFLKKGEGLEAALKRCGGGLEIRTTVRLPIGSGLGTSSILAATVIRALAEMRGEPMGDHALSDEVMRLEQLMTTGGGWQDQAGGIFPGAKLLSTGPGLRQRIRVAPVAWDERRQAEFAERLVIYGTGIQRMAKNLLKQVVFGYLAREVATVQVLHSIKTLAMEMAYAMEQGEWKYLGELLDRHWQLNQVLDPHTTNAPINALLDTVRPYIDGVKLAGAGGGGFLILLASGREEAAVLKKKLGKGICGVKVAEGGMRVVSG